MVIFTGKMTALCFAPNVIVRITPSLQDSLLPPVPPAGTVVQIETRAGPVRIRILTSNRACVVAKLNDEQWIMTPLKPTETQGVASYPEGSGATDWVVRAKA